MNGAEEKTFYVTGTTAQAEVKVGKNKTIFVLKKNYPVGMNTEYTVYKLDANLTVKGQKIISFPDGFNIININVFETDHSNNVYLAGDGQYPGIFSPEPASFVLKTDKKLITKWKWMDSTQTSFTRLHVDASGIVSVLADFYSFFPDIHLTRISANGQQKKHFTIQTDPGRYTMYSALDGRGDLLFYGNKSTGTGGEGMFLYKFSKQQQKIIYRKTHFIAAGLQINDLKVDGDGNIFSLVAQFQSSGALTYKISRINSNTGNISWNQPISFSQDSCNLLKLVVSGDDRFYAVGYRLTNNYFCKGFALRIKKNGHTFGNFPAPDSVNFQRLHWLSDGIIGYDNRLIAIGGTSDLDTTTFNSSYLRAFAVRFTQNNCDEPDYGRPGAETTAPVTRSEFTEKEELELTGKLVVYPNPVSEKISVVGMNKDQYDMLTVYNMQGAQILKQTISGNSVEVVVNSLPEGVYLLVLRSSVTMKEKNMKFVVRR